MKEIDIYTAIGDIDDELLGDVLNEKPARKAGFKTVKWLAAAAAFALLATTGFMYAGQKTVTGPDPHPEYDSCLPKIVIGDMFTGGFGFEGYVAEDISQLVNSNPWNEDMSLSTLPVYNSPLYYDDFHILVGADYRTMKEKLLSSAAGFGIDENRLVITDNAMEDADKKEVARRFEKAGVQVPEEYFKPTIVTGKKDDISIEVERDLTVTIIWENGISLPDEYNFNHFASYRDTKKTAGYIEEEFGYLINYSQPVLNIDGGDYNIYFDKSYHISFFDGAGSDRDRIVNYNFNHTDFYCNDEGKLFIARVYAPDLSQKLGDYPIITTSRAQKLLTEGFYYTSAPYDMRGEKYIAAKELVYMPRRGRGVIMPFYRFYVEIPQLRQNWNRDLDPKGDIKTYGAYYVPAVEGIYIENMPVYNG